MKLQRKMVLHMLLPLPGDMPSLDNYRSLIFPSVMLEMEGPRRMEDIHGCT